MEDHHRSETGSSSDFAVEDQQSPGFSARHEEHTQKVRDFRCSSLLCIRMLTFSRRITKTK